MPAGNGYHDPLFYGSCHLTKDLSCSVSKFGVVDLPEDQLKGNISFFSGRKYNVGSPPDWFLNPINKVDGEKNPQITQENDELGARSAKRDLIMKAKDDV